MIIKFTKQTQEKQQQLYYLKQPVDHNWIFQPIYAANHHAVCDRSRM